MKKVMTMILITIFLVVGGVSFYIHLHTDERLVVKYAKNKYGLDVEIKDEYTTGIASDREFIVVPKDHHDLEFSVIVDSYSNVTDNYSIALKADQHLHKLEKVLKDIEQLGFEGANNGEVRVTFVEDVKNIDQYHFIVHLVSSSPIEIQTFEKNDVNRFFELQKLIKQSKASIHRLIVSDLREPTEGSSIVLNMANLKNVNTSEELLKELSKSNWELASLYVNEKWESERAKIENERFTFGSEYSDYWFNCLATNENGECTNIFVSVYFAENSLTKNNDKLEEDLTSIFTLFEKTITPKAAIEYSFIEFGSDDSIRFTDQERAKYDSIKALINSKF